MNEVELDFSKLLTPGINFAVYCQTECDARNFLSQLRKEYPNSFKSWNFSDEDTRFSAYPQVCYSPDINLNRRRYLTYGSMRYYQENGFTIVHYEELIAESEISESDQPISVLLGGPQ